MMKGKIFLDVFVLFSVEPRFVMRILLRLNVFGEFSSKPRVSIARVNELEILAIVTRKFH